MKTIYIALVLNMLVVLWSSAFSQPQQADAPVWSPDLGNGRYKNPVIYADYSDPDAIRVGDDFYLTASSFGHFPGLAVLHSKDLINWTIIGHAVQNYPFPEFEKPQHGNAIWAPSIRYHNGEFYIYFGDPDRGVFMTKAKDPAGPWEPLTLIRRVTGWIDCCPFWDEDGTAYLVHAFANSRCGIKSILAINKMNAEGTKVLDDGVLVFNGQVNHPTIEGPKLYKRNGYYYIFAPAGGVKPGWQTVLRSKNIFGPYEDKITLEQGSTTINGPHQGAWVTTQTGEDWFIHFQDRYAYGRIVHLQPMKWENDWPVMGVDHDKNGIGEPVSEYVKPNVGKNYPVQVPQTSDVFDNKTLGLQWQWQSNFNSGWYSLEKRPGYLRLYAAEFQADDRNLWDVGRILLQKMPAEQFVVTTKLTLNSGKTGGKAGLLVFGRDYSYLAIGKEKDHYSVSQVVCKNADRGAEEKMVAIVNVSQKEIFLKVEIKPENATLAVPRVICNFSYSLDGEVYLPLGESFEAREGQWVGAKVGLFSIAPGESPETDYTDIDWFRISKL
ncbi:MAG: glycoside hydrolase 43 family protein [Mangrovibacterium sp.]